MNTTKLFSKTMSVLASLMLAIAGSFATISSAQAAPPTNVTAPSISGTPVVGQVLNAVAGTWNPNTGALSYSWVRCDAAITAQPISGGAFPAGCFQISMANQSSYTVAIADLGKYISIRETSGIAADSAGHLANSTMVVTAAAAPSNTTAASFTLANGVATATPGVWSSGSASFLWLVCDNSYSASSGATSSSPPADCGPFSATDSNTWITTTPLTLPETAWRWTGPTTRVNGSLAGKHLAVYENNSGWVMSATQAIGGATQQQATEQVTRSVERYVAPAFQAPLFNSLTPQGFTGLGNNGGRLVLKDIKVADIKSVTLNGTALTVVESKSGSAVKVPAGAKAGDLIFAMTDGTTITVPNVVKINTSQVDEKLVDLKNLPKFSGTGTSVPTAIASALNKQKALIADSTSAKCVGYATANTAAAKAIALARATNVCGVITNINESIEPIIKVVVNKTIAKKSAVRYLTW